MQTAGLILKYLKAKVMSFAAKKAGKTWLIML
jgi:hypothetical protein